MSLTPAVFAHRQAFDGIFLIMTVSFEARLQHFHHRHGSKRLAAANAFRRRLFVNQTALLTQSVCQLNCGTISITDSGQLFWQSPHRTQSCSRKVMPGCVPTAFNAPVGQTAIQLRHNVQSCERTSTLPKGAFSGTSVMVRLGLRCSARASKAPVSRSLLVPWSFSSRESSSGESGV